MELHQPTLAIPQPSLLFLEPLHLGMDTARAPRGLFCVGPGHALQCAGLRVTPDILGLDALRRGGFTILVPATPEQDQHASNDDAQDDDGDTDADAYFGARREACGATGGRDTGGVRSRCGARNQGVGFEAG